MGLPPFTHVPPLHSSGPPNTPTAGSSPDAVLGRLGTEPPPACTNATLRREGLLAEPGGAPAAAAAAAAAPAAAAAAMACELGEVAVVLRPESVAGSGLRASGEDGCAGGPGTSSTPLPPPASPALLCTRSKT
jgi:hypothetical protein